MQEDATLIAKKRELNGSYHARRMRKAGRLPAVIYAEGKEATSIELDAHAFELLLHHHASETMIVDLDLEGEGQVSALIKDVQHHPVTGELVHVDLQKMDAKVAIHVEVDVVPVGEAAGVKAGGTMDVVLHSLEVECLPNDLVETFEIDVSKLEIGDHLTVGDLNLGANFKVLTDPESIVIAITGPRAEEEATEEGGEPEVITQKNAE